MLDMDLDVCVLRESTVGARWVAGRVGVAVGARVRVAHVVGRGGVLAADEIVGVVVVRVGIGATVGAALQLYLGKQVGVAVAVEVGPERDRQNVHEVSSLRARQVSHP